MEKPIIMFPNNTKLRKQNGNNQDELNRFIHKIL